MTDCFYLSKNGKRGDHKDGDGDDNGYDGDEATMVTRRLWGRA